MGLNVDTAAVEDPELLRTCIEGAFAELQRVGEKPSPRRRKPAAPPRPDQTGRVV